MTRDTLVRANLILIHGNDNNTTGSEDLIQKLFPTNAILPLYCINSYINHTHLNEPAKMQDMKSP